MKSVILAGGLGTRLLPYTMFLPKPMLPLGEKPILEHLVEWNLTHGIDQIVLCISYLGRLIEDYFGDGEKFGAFIQYAASRRPLATAGQLRTAESLLKDTFVCMYGDSVYEFDLREMIHKHQRSKALITMGLYEYESAFPYGVIDTDSNDNVLAWREKPQTTYQINTGCYVMEPDVMSYIPQDKPWGMDSVIKSAMEDGRVVLGHKIRGSFTDVGTRPSYEDLNKKYRERLGDI